MTTFNRLAITRSREVWSSDLLLMIENLVRELHAGQLYGVEDYVQAHLIPVAGIVAAMGYGELYQATALLHDAPEDNKLLTPDYLLARGVPRVVVTASFTLDKSQYDSHDQYRRAVAADPLALVAKTGDSLFNLTNILNGIHHFAPEKAFSKTGEYRDNLAYFMPLLPQPNDL